MAIVMLTTNTFDCSCRAGDSGTLLPEGSRIGAPLTTQAASGAYSGRVWKEEITSGAGGGTPPGLWKDRGHFCSQHGLWQKCVAGSLGFKRISTYGSVYSSTQSGDHQHLASSETAVGKDSPSFALAKRISNPTKMACLIFFFLCSHRFLSCHANIDLESA